MTSQPTDDDDMVTWMFEAVHRGHVSRAMHGEEQGEDIDRLNQISAECKEKLKRKIGKNLFDKILTKVSLKLRKFNKKFSPILVVLSL